MHDDVIMSEHDIGVPEPPDAKPDAPPREQLLGRQLLDEISDGMTLLTREHYGRGPTNAQTYVLDNLIVCVLRDRFIALERTMIEAGEPARVLEMRSEYERLMKTQYSELIENLTGRKVLAFLSQTHVQPDLTVEMFLMDGRLPGFGTLELVVDHSED